jgi:hypothetical protein
MSKDKYSKDECMNILNTMIDNAEYKNRNKDYSFGDIIKNIENINKFIDCTKLYEEDIRLKVNNRLKYKNSLPSLSEIYDF